MSNNQTNKPRLAFQLLVAAGLVSFAAWSVAQIPPTLPGIPAGWFPSSDGGCLKPSNQSKLNNAQKDLCESERISANDLLCEIIGGKYEYIFPSGRCLKP